MFRNRTGAVCATLSATLLLLGACAPTEEAPQSNATVFEGATIIVGDGSDPIENGVFVVEDGRFVAAGAADAVMAPEGAARVDLSGRFVIPALIDTHVHLSVDREALIDDLQRRAYYGVGAAVSLGHDDGDATAAVRDNPVLGAALAMTAGRGITRPEPGRSEAPYWVSTEDEARTAVQELAAANVDFVKIWVDDRGGQYEKLTADLYGPVIEEAHEHGLRVTAHIFSLEDAKGLLEAGVDSFAHSVRDMDVDDEFVAMVQERPDVVLIPNLGGRGAHEDMSFLSGTLSGEALEAAQAQHMDRPEAHESFGIQARNLARLNEAGMKIVMGTDGNAGWRPHIEMRDMVESGMTPHEVIVASTSAGAEYLMMHDTGSIAAGKSADFVVLGANPLDDITNTRNIESVYLRGEEVDRAGLSAGWVGSQ
ncbi:MAG: amidohydrolase family protein [Acidobacteriota bacterium]|nr:amidohydrolase family protein [Acidobacteriota bacterium]